MTFSANLGFLFADRSLPEAIHAAHAAGFDAVECHFPYAFDSAEVAAALSETGLTMLGLNTRPGDVQAGDFGLAAVPGRETEAREAIDEAIAYADAIKARNVHVMAGKTDGGRAASRVFRDNIAHACDRAAAYGLTILIEPINHRDVPGYHLCMVEAAADLIAEMDKPNLRLMFDCYHTQIMQGDLTRRIEAHLPVIGHIQIAAVPDRGEPDEGEIAFARLVAAIRAMGHAAPIGAEYKPRGASTEAGLGWLARFREKGL